MSKWLGTIFLLCILAGTATILASSTNGTIDPNNTGNYSAAFLDNSGVTTSSLGINFGKFTTQSAYNITISDSGLRGYAWGALTGWIVTNCLDTTSGCSGSNGNFKVSVDSNGILSGYAWGENAGWINFGPFTNTGISQVKISPAGQFGGTLGNAGYAWSELFGWIIFDCSVGSTCVVTDYIPQASRTTTPSPPASIITVITQCSDRIDNDQDNLVDYPYDPGCIDWRDNNELGGTITPTPPQQPTPQIPIPPSTTKPTTPIKKPTKPTPKPPVATIPKPIETPSTTPTEEPPQVIQPPTEVTPPSIPSEEELLVLPPKAPVTTTQIKDAGLQAFYEAIQIVRNAMNGAMQSFAQFMGSSSGQEVVKNITILGIVISILIIVFMEFIVPSENRERIKTEARTISPLQRMVLLHEMAIRRIMLFIFGIGFFASVLLAIFLPSIVSLAGVVMYISMMVFRWAGLFGSEASVFVDKFTMLPIANRTVQVFDQATNKEVLNAWTSSFGRARLTLPKGSYYVRILPKENSGLVEGMPMTAALESSGGQVIRRFLL